MQYNFDSAQLPKIDSAQLPKIGSARLPAISFRCAYFLVVGRRVMLVMALMMTCSFLMNGQDINISQTYAAPLLLNPALTGGYDGNFRISTLYRDQWSGLVGDPFRSFLISGDARLDFGRRNKTGDHAGVGVLVASDKVNPYDFSTNSIFFNGAFHKKLGQSRVNYLSAGIQFGLAQKNFSYENFTFQDQFNGIDDYPFQTREDLPVNNYAYFDLSIGLNYATTINDDMTLEVGGAAFHLIEPNISFYQDVDVTSSPLINENALKQRIVGHVSSTIRSSNTLSLTPRLVFSTQGTHQQLMLGSGIRSVFNDVKELALHAGIWGRMTHDVDSYAFRDIVAMIGIEFSSVIVGLSYDISIDDISTYSAGQHTFEFSLRYTGNYQEDGYYCPQF